MKVVHYLLLEALKASLQNKNLTWSFEISDPQWQQLFKMACEQHILPMIYSAVCNCPAICRMNPAILSFYKAETKKAVAVQAIKTEEYLRILRYLDKCGLHPMTVKGLICRSLYPQPDARDSGDEDLLVPPGEFEACQKALCAIGLQRISSIRKGLPENACDIAFGRPGHPIYIELHPSPFPPDDGIYGSWNLFFRDIHGHTMKIDIHGQAVRTINAADHLFYLVCHALKHFYHSGFGIRQVCDILLFADHYKESIHWQQFYGKCQAADAVNFISAIFKIGATYLGFDPEMIRLPKQQQLFPDVNEAPLLADILAAGLYGDASVGRKHSSLMTLHALQQKSRLPLPQRLSCQWIPAFFPAFREMVRRYPQLHSKPWLLPAAWLKRWQHYFLEQAFSRQMSAGLSAVKTGAHRIRLMQYYQLIPEKHRKKGGDPDAAIHQFNEQSTKGDFLGNS